MKIVALTVTYNRLAWLKKNADAILRQTYLPDEFIIVDNNSTDGTKEYLQELERNNNCVTVIYLPENVGGSGGFAAGIKAAYEKNMDYVWGMDDDAVPHIDALEKLVEGAKVYPRSEICLRSNTYYMDKNGKFVKKQFTEAAQETSTLIFIGFFISRELVSTVGFPRDDLFIYYDDADYSMSIKEHGFKIIGIADSIIEHPDSLPDKRGSILGKSMNIPEMPKWKFYYWMRNNLLVRKGISSRGYGKSVILELYILVKLLFFKPAVFCIACKGFFHGILGKSGHLKGCP